MRGRREIAEACAKQGEGVIPTFFALLDRAWDKLDKDLKLAEKTGIDGEAFRRAVAEHIGST